MERPCCLLPTGKDENQSIVRAAVADTLELRRWLLGLGPRVEVVQPDDLGDEIAAKHLEASRLDRNVCDR
nr:WYL domain-containing protein [Aquisalimonas sp.]